MAEHKHETTRFEPTKPSTLKENQIWELAHISIPKDQLIWSNKWREIIETHANDLRTYHGSVSLNFFLLKLNGQFGFDSTSMVCQCGYQLCILCRLVDFNGADASEKLHFEKVKARLREPSACREFADYFESVQLSQLGVTARTDMESLGKSELNVKVDEKDTSNIISFEEWISDKHNHNCGSPYTFDQDVKYMKLYGKYVKLEDVLALGRTINDSLKLGLLHALMPTTSITEFFDAFPLLKSKFDMSIEVRKYWLNGFLKLKCDEGKTDRLFQMLKCVIELDSIFEKQCELIANVDLILMDTNHNYLSFDEFQRISSWLTISCQYEMMWRLTDLTPLSLLHVVDVIKDRLDNNLKSTMLTIWKDVQKKKSKKQETVEIKSSVTPSPLSLISDRVWALVRARKQLDITKMDDQIQLRLYADQIREHVGLISWTAFKEEFTNQTDKCTLYVLLWLTDFGIVLEQDIRDFYVDNNIWLTYTMTRLDVCK